MAVVHPEFSFAVEADWAVAGTLRAGDRIDVYTTYEGTGAPTSTRVHTNATIRRVAHHGACARLRRRSR